MLTPEKLESWYGKVVKVGYTGSFEDWSAERLKCQTDLFYLTKDVLGYDLVDNFYCPSHPTCQAEFEGPCSVCGQPLQAYPGNVFFDGKTSIHRATCKFFVQKNPNKLISQQDEIKNRLLMVPRGSLKSSIDQADCVQWIIAFPDVRIALLTAAEDLAQAFVVNVRRFFVVDESENGERTFTKFQLLFPEHCVKDADKGPKDSFITPGRETKNIPQPSLHAISLQKTTSGTHYDCGKSDDVVSNKNSGHSTTSEQRDNVRKDIGLARSLIEPYGYHDNIGTPYADDDAYAYQLATSDPDNLKVMIHPAWRVKPESEKKKLADPLYKLGATDYEYLVPFIIKKGQIEPRLDYKFLKTASADVENFPCQYLCQPNALRIVKFTKELFGTHTVGSEGLPQAGTYQTVMAWDFAYSDEKGRDFSVGSVGWMCIAGPLAGRCFVVDMVRGRFGKTELAQQVAKMAARWRVEKIGIENSSGANFLENDIMREVHRMGYSDCPIPEWFPVDTQKNAKNARAEGTETLLITDRLYFSSEIAILENVVKEFINFKPGSKRKDDAVDSIGHLCRYLPTHIEIPRTQQEKNQAVHDLLIQKQINELIFMAPIKPEPPPPPPPTSWDGMPVISDMENFILYGK